LLFGFRAFLYQPFNIPSGTMKPTLLVGDYIVVSKYAYGYSRFSFPGSSAPFAGRIFAGEPRHGDVVVFRLPRVPSTDYVKRLVGLPGDRIQMIKGALNLNGRPVKRERIEDFVETDASGRTTRGKQWRETLPNGASYVTLDLVDEGFYDNTPVYAVPAGHYFMMGDNRDNSQDSRMLSYHLRVIRSVCVVLATSGNWWSWRWFFDPGEARNSAVPQRHPDHRSYRSICSRAARRRAARDARRVVAPGCRTAGRPGERPLEPEDFADRASPRCRARE